MSTITEEQYRRLKSEVETAKQEADRAQGALDQLLTRLKEEFDCDNLKQAKQKLVEIESKRDKAQAFFEKAMNDYQKKWKDEQWVKPRGGPETQPETSNHMTPLTAFAIGLIVGWAITCGATVFVAGLLACAARKPVVVTETETETTNETGE
jgi:hypothetical protein